MYYDCNGNLIQEAKKTPKFNNLGIDSRKIPLCEYVEVIATHKDRFLMTDINYNNK